MKILCLIIINLNIIFSNGISCDNNTDLEYSKICYSSDTLKLRNLSEIDKRIEEFEYVIIGLKKFIMQYFYSINEDYGGYFNESINIIDNLLNKNNTDFHTIIKDLTLCKNWTIEEIYDFFSNKDNTINDYTEVFVDLLNCEDLMKSLVDFIKRNNTDLTF